MKSFGKLSRGKEILSEMMPMLKSNTRVVKFGSHMSVLSPREDDFSYAAVALGWNGASGGTYMWKMIEDDVQERYKPIADAGEELKKTALFSRLMNYE